MRLNLCDLGRGTYYIIKKSREIRIRHFLRAKANVEIMTSEYFKSLDYLAQRRYVEKLTIRDEVLPDPYSIGEESWTDDMAQWPDLVYGDLYSYLIRNQRALYQGKVESPQVSGRVQLFLQRSCPHCLLLWAWESCHPKSFGEPQSKDSRSSQ